MRKLFLSIIALTLSISAWAQETQSVNYIDADGQQKTVTATVVTNETETLSDGWYVVLGEVSRGTITCKGLVYLILADGAKLTAQGDDNPATPGIRVSGSDDKLIIYGQTYQTGQLNAFGGGYRADMGGAGAAGIGGEDRSTGSNITINGGIVLAKGGDGAAGIGGGYYNVTGGFNITINYGTVTAYGGLNSAGIGGGRHGKGSNITINGGIVTAVGGELAASIGGGYEGAGSNIKVSADCKVFADGNNPPTTEIAHNSDTDLASDLRARYAIIEMDQTILSALRTEAFAAIDEVIAGVNNVIILDFAQKAKNRITNATNRTAITAIKDSAITELDTLIKTHKSALGELGEEKAGTAVKVTKGDTEVILYAPEKVEYIIRK